VIEEIIEPVDDEEFHMEDEMDEHMQT